MKHYIIDSLNVINKCNFFKSKFLISKTVAISSFCEVLNVYAAKYPTYKFSAVIDGTEMPQSIVSSQIKLIRSGANETADNVIKNMISNTHGKSTLVVVSSDREVYNFARINACEAIESEEFIKLLFPQPAKVQKAGKNFKGEKPSHTSKKDFEEFKRLFSENED